MSSSHCRIGTDADAYATAQSEPQGAVASSAHRTLARFATNLRNNVRFAHAHHTHFQGQARSANARRLAKALAKKRRGRAKAATTRFATTRRQPAARPTGGTRGGQDARKTDRTRHVGLRVTRDGGSGGSGGGGQQQGEAHQDQRERNTLDEDLALSKADGANPLMITPAFASQAMKLTGQSRRDALASAWCDTLLNFNTHSHHLRSIYGARAQLHTVRQLEGALPLESLAEVKQALIDATARAIALQSDVKTLPADGRTADALVLPTQLPTASETFHVLAPLLALIAGAPVISRREARSTGINAMLDGARQSRAASTTGFSEEPGTRS